MAFPNTPVLTTFAGADENPLSEGGNWPANVDTDDADLQILSNQAAGAAAGACSMYWTTTYGPDCEVFVTVPTLPVGLDTAVYLRLADMGGATPDGYQGRMITDFGSPHLAVYNRMDNGAFTQLGGNIDLTWVAGDQLGLSVVGSTLILYQNGTALDTSRTDATYSAAGKIGLRATTTTPRLDSFGGGSLGAFAAYYQQFYRQRIVA